MMVRLPPIRVTQGEAFDYAATVTGQDWTGITGAVTFKAKPRGDVILTADVTGDADGVLSFSLTGDEASTLPALPVVGFRSTCVFEIAMSDGQLFQGTCAVAGRI